jgi:hypothetical protein
VLALDLTGVAIVGQGRDRPLIRVVILVDTRIIVLQVVAEDAALGSILPAHFLLGQVDHLLRATLFKLDLQVVDPSYILFLFQIKLVHPAQQTLLGIASSGCHAGLCLLEVLIGTLNLSLVVLFYLLQRSRVILLDLTHPNLIILLAQLSL